MNARKRSCNIVITSPFFVTTLALLFFSGCLLSLYQGNQAKASSSLTSSFVTSSHQQSLQTKQSWLIAICFCSHPTTTILHKVRLKLAPKHEQFRFSIVRKVLEFEIEEKLHFCSTLSLKYSVSKLWMLVVNFCTNITKKIFDYRKMS